MSYQLIVLAVLPGILIAAFIYYKDKYDREPLPLLLLTFFLGSLSIIPAATIETLLMGKETFHSGSNIAATLTDSFLFIGLTEEFCKYSCVRWFAYRNKAFNEPYDGIMYCVMAAMGFATAENLFYVYEGGMRLAWLRMFTAVPAHATFGIMMGYFMGLAKFSKSSFRWNMLGLLTAAAFHGAYDFSILQKINGLIYFGAAISLLVGVYLSLKAIKIQKKNSPFAENIPAEKRQ